MSIFYSFIRHKPLDSKRFHLGILFPAWCYGPKNRFGLSDLLSRGAPTDLMICLSLKSSKLFLDVMLGTSVLVNLCCFLGVCHHSRAKISSKEGPVFYPATLPWLLVVSLYIFFCLLKQDDTTIYFI